MDSHAKDANDTAEQNQQNQQTQDPFTNGCPPQPQPRPTSISHHSRRPSVVSKASSRSTHPRCLRSRKNAKPQQFVLLVHKTRVVSTLLPTSYDRMIAKCRQTFCNGNPVDLTVKVQVSGSRVEVTEETFSIFVTADVNLFVRFPETDAVTVITKSDARPHFEEESEYEMESWATFGQLRAHHAAAMNTSPESIVLFCNRRKLFEWETPELLGILLTGDVVTCYDAAPPESCVRYSSSNSRRTSMAS